MAFAPFTCALGDSPEVEITTGATVDIAPADDSVDTNRVRIVGTGTIESFGVACNGVQGELGEQATVTKRVAFVPTAPGITLHHNPPGLVLLGGVDRVISKPAFGEYQSDSYGWWTETNYSASELTPTKSGGQLIAFIYYIASATITIPPGATRAWVRMWGGSGASGNGSVVAGVLSSSGVGAPGYLEKFLTGLTPSNTLTFTRGAAGVITGGNGGNGSASILASGTQTIATLTANGSIGTPLGGASFAAPGGTASGGDINLTGQAGGYSTPQIVGDGSMPGNTIPGVGGVTMLARGPNGNAFATGYAGNPGFPGGLIIAWFNDAFL